MRSVADQLRHETGERVARMSVAERIELALSLGAEDLLLYMRASGKTRDEALRDLRTQRGRGRSYSRTASPSP
jgi:hypothetical protein